MPIVRDATVADASFLASHLRAADLQEIAVTSDRGPNETLVEGLERSLAAVCVTDEQGEPIFLAGISATPRPDLGIIWGMGSVAIERNVMWFLRNSRQLTDMGHKHFPLLTNFVDSRNALHIRWLKWCGFQFPGTSVPAPFDPSVPLLYFVRHHQCVNQSP